MQPENQQSQTTTVKQIQAAAVEQIQAAAAAVEQIQVAVEQIQAAAVEQIQAAAVQQQRGANQAAAAVEQLQAAAVQQQQQDSNWGGGELLRVLVAMQSIHEQTLKILKDEESEDEPIVMSNLVFALIGIDIGVLLLPLGLSVPPEDRVFSSGPVLSDCTIDSLVPIMSFTSMAILFLVIAIVSAAVVKIGYKRSTNGDGTPNTPNHKAIFLGVALVALIATIISFMLGAIILFISIQIKSRKFSCLPVLVRFVLVVTGAIVVALFAFMIYYSVRKSVRAPDHTPAVPDSSAQGTRN